MGSWIGGEASVGARVALLGTVFAAFVAIALPAQAARQPTTHHTAPAHGAHAAAAHSGHASKASAAQVSTSGKARLVHVSTGKHIIAPIAKERLRHSGRAVAGHHAAHSKSGKARYTAASYRGISCVPFARAASGIELKGNATNWWDAAAGVYARGARPEPGAVLNFRSTGKMRLGHVAVVARVINSREVEVDHANWAGPGLRKGQVARGIAVVDVSLRNDWSEVRVSLGGSDNFGSVYPTYGFIYDRPDRGLMVANTLAPSHGGIAAPGAQSHAVEVADAPLRGRGSVNVLDVPNRALR